MNWKDVDPPKITKAGRPTKSNRPTVNRSVSFDANVLEALKTKKKDGEGSVSDLLMKAAKKHYLIG